MTSSKRRNLVFALSMSLVVGGGIWWGWSASQDARQRAEIQRDLISSMHALQLDEDEALEMIVVWTSAQREGADPDDPDPYGSLLDAVDDDGQRLWSTWVPPQHTNTTREENITLCGQTLVVAAATSRPDEVEPQVVHVGLDPTTGAQRWRVLTQESGLLLSFGARCLHGLVHAHVLPDPGSGLSAEWVALEPSTGEVAWRVPVKEGAAPPARLGDRHLLSWGNRQGVIVDPRSGEVEELPEHLGHVVLQDDRLLLAKYLEDTAPTEVLGQIRADAPTWAPLEPPIPATGGPFGVTDTHIIYVSTGPTLANEVIVEAVSLEGGDLSWRLEMPGRWPALAHGDDRDQWAPEHDPLGRIQSRYLPLVIGVEDHMRIVIIDLKEGELTWESERASMEGSRTGHVWRDGSVYWVTLTLGEEEGGAWAGFDGATGKFVSAWSVSIPEGDDHRAHLGVTSRVHPSQIHEGVLHDFYWDSAYLIRLEPPVEVIQSYGWPAQVRDRRAEVAALLGELP